LNRAWLTFGAALLAVACQTIGIEPSVPANQPDGFELGVVTRVNDGDSGLVDVGGTIVEFRLEGINAPERAECHGEDSSDHLAALVEGATVGVELTGTDQFGRSLAYMWLDDAPVNLELVSGGHAVATTPGQGETRGEALIAAEIDAASEERGLWSESACGGTGPVPDIAVDPLSSRFDPDGPDEEVLEEELVTFDYGETLDLAGWTIRDESSAHRCVIPDGTLISADRPLTVTSADQCWDPGENPVWNNAGDLVLLLDPLGRVAARYRYTG